MPRRLSIAICSRVRLVRPSKTTRLIRCSHLRYRAVIVIPLPRRAVLASPTSSLALRRSLTEEFSSAISRVVASATFNGQFPLSVEDKRVAPNRLTLQVQSLCACCSKSKRESPRETQVQATLTCTLRILSAASKLRSLDPVGSLTRLITWEHAPSTVVFRTQALDLGTATKTKAITSLSISGTLWIRKGRNLLQCRTTRRTIK